MHLSAPARGRVACDLARSKTCGGAELGRILRLTVTKRMASHVRELVRADYVSMCIVQHVSLSLSIYIYIYTHTYIHIHTYNIDIYTHTHTHTHGRESSSTRRSSSCSRPRWSSWRRPTWRCAASLTPHRKPSASFRGTWIRQNFSKSQ